MKNNNFSKYQLLFNSSLNDILNKEGLSNDLYNMIIYALKSGKRLRPIISIDICLSLGGKLEDVINFAVAIELIHNASLIIDDLPCMDNDDYRRNKLSFHKKYGLYNSQMIISILINFANNLIIENFTFDSNKLLIILEIISKNIGITGAAGGQYIDLHIEKFVNKSSSSKSKDLFKKLVNMKTSTLFEIAFIGGYLSNIKKNMSKKNEIINLAKNFGFAFQLYDDFDDIDKDKKKNSKINPNYINQFGITKTTLEFNKSINECNKILNNLKINNIILNEIISYLVNKVKIHIKYH